MSPRETGRTSSGGCLEPDTPIEEYLRRIPRGWTSLPVDTSGTVLVEGALNPVHVSVENDYAVYVEPNVWIVHRTGRG